MYELIFFISVICLSADGSNFTGWLIWEAVWLAVMIFSGRRMGRDVE